MLVVYYPVDAPINLRLLFLGKVAFLSHEKELENENAIAVMYFATF
jgi:hypothetical protein